MIRTKLKVAKTRKGFVGFVFMLAAIQACLILTSIFSKPNAVVLGRVLSIVYFVIFLTLVLTYLLFKVEVIDSTISVRTKIGKCYSFTFSEITKIVCDMFYDRQYRQVGIIRIEITHRKFEIEQTMDGFQEMAGYILEKLESGEINEAAASANVMRNLRKYKSGKKMLI